MSGGSTDSAVRSRAAGAAWAGLVGLTALLHLCGLELARDLWAHFAAQLWLWIGAGLCWGLALLALLRARPLRPGSRGEKAALLWLWTVALLMRGPALLLPVGHSDDVYRYLWDGAVQQAGLSPYAGPPDAEVYAAVRAAHPALPERINHRELPTIYPPTAQLAFRLHAALAAGPLSLEAAVRRWKGLVLVADLLVLGLLVGLCRRLGRDVRWAALWGAAPLCAVELAGNGHVESLGLLPLLAALRLWLGAGWRLRAGSPAASPLGDRVEPQPAAAAGAGDAARGDRVVAAAIGILVALAVLVKPVAGAVLPAMLRWPRRVLWAAGGAGVLTAALLVLPYHGKGLVPPSLGEYGRRWRSNEGAYAVVHAAAEGAVAGLYRPPYFMPWRRPWLAQLITGRDRDTVWPDELAAALARAAVVLLLGGLAVLGVRRRLAPERLGLGLLLGYQLLTPILHPWYELWPLALCLLWPRLAPPVVVMAALAPLAYLPLPDYLAGRGFHESVWPRLMQHGAGWLAVLGAYYGGPRLSLPQESIDAIPRRDTLPPQTP